MDLFAQHNADVKREYRLSPADHGKAGASDALEGVGGGISEATKADILAGIASFPNEFSTDMLRGKLSQASRDILDHPHHRNAMQGMIVKLAQVGRLTHVGWVRSVRPEARGRMIRVWLRGVSEAKERPARD